MVDMPKCNCPFCNAKFDMATMTVGDDKGNVRDLDETKTPGPGCITLCINCLMVLVFTDNLTVRKPTFRELEDLPPETWKKIRTLQKAIGIVRSKGN